MSSLWIRLGTIFSLGVFSAACSGSSVPLGSDSGLREAGLGNSDTTSDLPSVVVDVPAGSDGPVSTPDSPDTHPWAEAGANDSPPFDGQVDADGDTFTPTCTPTHGTLTFASNDIFVVPACVTSVIVEAYAGGGAGGLGHNFASSCSGYSTGGGGGGSGGNYLKGKFTVAPGATIPVVVAAMSCGQSSTQWWAADGNISGFGSLLVTSAASGGEDAGYAGCFAQGEGGFTYGTLGDIGGNLADLAGAAGGSGSASNNDGGIGGHAAGPAGGEGGGYGIGSANCTCLSGTDGVFPGGGGGGGGNTYGACPLSACSGGCGAAGEVIVTW